MTTTTTFPHTSSIAAARQPKRPIASRDNEKQAIWVPMLLSASKGKDLAEKQLIILGGSPDQQKDFLDQLNPPTPHGRPNRYNDRRRQKQTPPVSNKYALGYTYHDVLDVDHEDVLARLNVHMLSSSLGALAPLLKPLLTTKTANDTLVVILLDWANPFIWARQLRQWIRLLRSVILGLDDETKLVMEENMDVWKNKRTVAEGQPFGDQKGMPSIPLGPGEWDEVLGVPLSVVCMGGENIPKLEKQLGWQEEEFDFLLQWLRTVLLKHGASLIYTASSDPNNVRTLVHTTLGIESMLKREVVKHNVIDRDKVLVPPNWDAWGKIRILREAFNPEALSEQWSVEIEEPPDDILDVSQRENNPAASSISLFEGVLKPPVVKESTTQFTTSNEITTTVPPFQEFLQTQQVILDQLKADEEKRGLSRPGYSTGGVDLDESSSPVKGSSSRMAEQIGPYQINVNGIDLDAEEATRRLKDREQERNLAGTTNKKESTGYSTPTKTKVGTVEAADGKPSTEQMSAFFASLMKKPAGVARTGSQTGSGMASPRRESPAPDRRREQ